MAPLHSKRKHASAELAKSLRPKASGKKAARASLSDDEYDVSDVDASKVEDSPPPKSRRTGLQSMAPRVVALATTTRRSGRLTKVAQDKETARKFAEAANLTTLFMQLPELRNVIYELCLESAFVSTRHDVYNPSPFEGLAPSRALTQVCRQIRGEFLLVYKRTTTIRVPLEDLNEYIVTWLQKPAIGTLIIDTKRYNKDRRDEGSMMRTDGKLRVDLTPLVKLRLNNKDFCFHINLPSHRPSPKDQACDLEEDQEHTFESHVLKIELETENWLYFNFTLHMTQAFAGLHGEREDGLIDVKEGKGAELMGWLREIKHGACFVWVRRSAEVV